MQTDPVWFKCSSDRKAHLIHHREMPPGATITTHARGPDIVTWCQMLLPKESIEAPNGPRCADCMSIFRRYSELALAEPPPMVTETVTITAVRRSDDDEDLMAWLGRRAHSKKSWEFRFQRTADHVPESDPAAFSSPAHWDE